MFVGVSGASLTYFGDLLHCPYKRIFTITKVYIATNNIHVEIVRFRNDILKFQVDESPLVYRATVVSDDSNFDLSTAVFHVTMYGKSHGTSVQTPIRL